MKKDSKNNHIGIYWLFVKAILFSDCTGTYYVSLRSWNIAKDVVRKYAINEVSWLVLLFSFLLLPSNDCSVNKGYKVAHFIDFSLCNWNNYLNYQVLQK